MNGFILTQSFHEKMKNANYVPATEILVNFIRKNLGFIAFAKARLAQKR